MATLKQSSKKRLNMAERAEELMQIQFPDIAKSSLIWTRQKNNGYTTVPRTLPIAMQAIDVQSKGKPAGHVLFCLWARSPDHPLIVIENPSTFATEAGFYGERAVDTWRKRMKKLRELNFILTKPGSSGDFHYTLLLNPNAALEKMRMDGLINDAIYPRFFERMNDIGANTELNRIREFFKDDEEEQPAKTSKKTNKKLN